MIILIKLILAHLIGDFFLQSDKLIKEKEEKKFMSLAFYLHVCVHGILAMLIIWDITILAACSHTGHHACINRWLESHLSNIKKSKGIVFY